MKSLVLWVLVLCVAAGAWFMGAGSWFHSATDSARSVTTPAAERGRRLSSAASDSTRGAVVAIPESTRSAIVAPVRAPLPAVPAIPTGTPVAAVIAALRADADSGNREAACRLGLELARCAALDGTAKRIRDKIDIAIRQQGTPVGDQAKLESEKMTADLKLEESYCATVPPDYAREAWRYVYQAAGSGSVTAMAAFVRTPPMQHLDLADSAEGWMRYKTEAPQLLWGAIQGGDVAALYTGWFNAASGLSAGGRNVFQRDPYMAIVYGTAAQTLVAPLQSRKLQRNNATAAQEIGAQRAAQAAAEGEALRARYFSGVTTPGYVSENGAVSATECGR